jgi:hypothetical protein
MTLRRVNDFSTKEPDKLERELIEFEDNTERETRDIRANFLPVPQLISFRAISGVTNRVLAQLDQQLGIDTLLADCTVLLPILAAKNFGRRLTVIKRVGNGSIFITCVDPLTKINGSTTPITLSAAGQRTIFCDQEGYFG